jgi:uncharacterized protein with PIN domain
LSSTASRSVSITSSHPVIVLRFIPCFVRSACSAQLRPDHPGNRFAVDVNLGRLARYLRLLGFDAISDGRLDDRDLAELAATEDRILLTRDRHLLKRSVVVHGYLVRTVMPTAQIVEVVRRFNLADRMDPFARCMECNGVIEEVAKREVDHLLEPLTREHFEEFRRCSECGRVFWRGSHFAQLATLIEGVRRQVARSRLALQQPAGRLNVVGQHLAVLETPGDGLSGCPQSCPVPVESQFTGEAVESIHHVFAAVPQLG